MKPKKKYSLKVFVWMHTLITSIYNFILLHVSMIRVLLASSCMYGSPPSPNCLPLHVHEKLATMSQQIIYVLVMDELQNKPWRVLVQGSSSYMHTQCKSSTHYYSISRPVV